MSRYNNMSTRFFSCNASAPIKVVLIKSNLCISQEALRGGRINPDQKSENLVLLLDCGCLAHKEYSVNIHILHRLINNLNSNEYTNLAFLIVCWGSRLLQYKVTGCELEMWIQLSLKTLQKREGKRIKVYRMHLKKHASHNFHMTNQKKEVY